MKLMLFIILCCSHVFAAPLIYSTSDGIFYDHEKEILYYVPGESSLKLDSHGTPMFHMAYGDLGERSPIDGEIIATFELKPTEYQKKEIARYQERGYEIRLLEYTQSSVIGNRHWIGSLNAPSLIKPLEAFQVEAKTAFSSSIVSGHLIYNNSFQSSLFELWYRADGITSFIKAEASFNEAIIASSLHHQFANRKKYSIERDRIRGFIFKLFREKKISFRKEKGSKDQIEEKIYDYLVERFFELDTQRSKVGAVYYFMKQTENYEDKFQTIPFTGRFPISRDFRILLSTEAAGNRPDLFNKL